MGRSLETDRLSNRSSNPCLTIEPDLPKPAKLLHIRPHMEELNVCVSMDWRGFRAIQPCPQRSPKASY